ncbi:hypothetical protein [Sphingomonas sp.]|uniref:hypothetical protein n=1 Tax=Sphingomonas sp. TaxID=28214 RepID=UPI002EDB7D2A
MPRIDSSRAVGAYAAVMTAIAGWSLLSGVATPPQRFDTIDVRRINVRENDGTLRMIIAGRDNIGGLIVEDREYPHPNRTEAGMIFFNDEGTENGGLVFDGGLKNGKPINAGSLTFDRWRQDQTVQLRSYEDGAERSAGLVVNDRPDRPMAFEQMAAIRAMPDGPARNAAHERAGFGKAERVYLGSRPDRSSELALRDAAGRPRLVLRVEGDGAASIRFLDEAGKVVRTTTP